MDLISVITVAIIIPTIFYVYFKRSFGYWRDKGVPYDEPSIPYGNIKDLGKTIHPADFTKRLYDKYKPTGAKLCGTYFFNRPVAVLLDLELVKNVLVKDFKNFNERGLYFNEADDPLTAHLFSLNGVKWKELRPKITSTFSSSKMKCMFSTIVDVGERFRDCLFEVIEKRDQIEMKELLSRFTTDVIGTCVFGIESNSLSNPDAEFRSYGRKLFDKPRHNVLVRRFLDEYDNIGRKLHVKKIPNDIAAFFMRVVRDTVEYREKNHVKRNDFMDLMIELKNHNEITFNELAAQAFVFYQAGFESSSTTLAFCLYELALNQEIQTKARNFVQEAYKKYNGKFTYEMMMDIPFIDQILHETLRKYPPTPYMPRRTQNDYQVPKTNICIEKGTTVLIPVHAIHHDPEYYPNPDKFDPDRFKKAKKENLDSMTLLSFGGGPRNCIGKRFGMMQVRIGLVMLLLNFNFSLGSNMTVPITINNRVFLLTPQYVYLKLMLIK